MPNVWPFGTCLVAGDSVLNDIDETCMPRKFNVELEADFR